jgi:hypothetical protein
MALRERNCDIKKEYEDNLKPNMKLFLIILLFFDTISKLMFEIKS